MRPAVEVFEEMGNWSEERPPATAGIATWKQLLAEASPGNVRAGGCRPDPRGHPLPDGPITWYASDNDSTLTNAKLLQCLLIQFNTKARLLRDLEVAILEFKRASNQIIHA